MEITASELRADIYRIIDRVIQTGEPVSIRRKNDRVLLIPEKGKSRIERLVPRCGYVTCDPDELVHLDWSETWKP